MKQRLSCFFPRFWRRATIYIFIFPVNILCSCGVDWCGGWYMEGGWCMVGGESLGSLLGCRCVLYRQKGGSVNYVTQKWRQGQSHPIAPKTYSRILWTTQPTRSTPITPLHTRKTRRRVTQFMNSTTTRTTFAEFVNIKTGEAKRNSSLFFVGRATHLNIDFDHSSTWSDCFNDSAWSVCTSTTAIAWKWSQCSFDAISGAVRLFLVTVLFVTNKRWLPPTYLIFHFGTDCCSYCFYSRIDQLSSQNVTRIVVVVVHLVYMYCASDTTLPQCHK